MSSPRQAAGTHSLTDLVRLRWWSSSTSDLEALDRGETLAISAFDVTDKQRAQGRLLVVTQPSTTLTWQPFVSWKGFGTPVPLPRPYAWVSEDGRPAGLKGTFRQVTLRIGGRPRQLCLSYKDLPTLETVLTEATGN